MITIGTFGGYLIILVGLFAGSLMGTPVNRRVVRTDRVKHTIFHFNAKKSTKFVMLTRLTYTILFLYSLYVSSFKNMISKYNSIEI